MCIEVSLVEPKTGYNVFDSSGKDSLRGVFNVYYSRRVLKYSAPEPSNMCIAECLWQRLKHLRCA